MKKRVHTMITAFRDGFQSCYGARVLTDDFIDVVSSVVEAGMTHLEVAGGARFQSLYFYCNEDAFAMMDRIRAAAGSGVQLQSLSRGVSVVALDTQPRDIVRLHAQLFQKHGIDTVRNFDALNDVDNLEYSARCLKEAGLEHEVAITVMELPPGKGGAHDPPFYEGILRRILDSGLPFDSLCFKDATGTLTPATAYETVRLARRLLGPGIKIAFHNHETAGIGALTYRAALDAGADQIDLSLAPVSGGTCQTDVVVMWHALRGTEYDLGLDIRKVLRAEAALKQALQDYFLPPEAVQVEPLIPFSPLPGGALTANTQMLRDNGLMDRYPEVIAAMEEAVARGGFGTSVTPVSQFYFQQAFLNVLHGPWKKISEGYGRMILGYFGKTPVPPDPELVRLASAQLGLEPARKTALELADEDPTKGTEAARRQLAENGLPDTPENVFIVATCKEKGLLFLKGQARPNVRKVRRSDGNVYLVEAAGRRYRAEVVEDGVRVDGELIHVRPLNPSEAGAPSVTPETPSAPAGAHTLTAPLPGLVVRFLKREGQAFQAGEGLLVVESMKEEHVLPAPAAGVLSAWTVHQGDQVRTGQTLGTWRPT